ncbi:MAG: aspartate kinase [Solobacterium sp.]|nr:aspartate kinase [Solobacterium sp.]
MTKAVKFGGTSLADGNRIRHACSIVQADAERRFMVVSAPGKRYAQDEKVTDLLYRLYEEEQNRNELLDRIFERFAGIVQQLQIEFDLEAERRKIEETLREGCNVDAIVSRGEYLNARITAAYMGWPFVDAANLIRFRENGRLEEALTYHVAKSVLEEYECAVIPGFYGSGPNGVIRVFSRGGSDVTGAIIARAVEATVYENWTDVTGIMSADPRVIENPHAVHYISYRELRELSYMGASVLHEDAIFPLKNTGIPIRVCNTMEPEKEGTWIVARYPVDRGSHPVTGIAGKKGFSNLQIEMAMMNTQIGFGARILEIVANHGISYEHTPTSIDIMSVIADTKAMDPHRNELIMEIDQEFHPDRIFIEDNMSLIAVVGEGISANVGVAARVLQSIAEAGINVRMIDAGCSELNIIIGVNDCDYEKTIRALYQGLYEFL